MHTISAPKTSSQSDDRSITRGRSVRKTTLVLAFAATGLVVAVAATYLTSSESLAHFPTIVGALGLWWTLDRIYCRLAKNQARPLDVIDGENVLTHFRLVSLGLLPEHRR